MSLFETIYKDIAEEYRVDIQALSKAFNLESSRALEFLDFSILSDLSLEELNKLLFLTISWIEHINYKKALVSGVVSIKKSEINQKEAIFYLNAKSSAIENNKKITVSDLEYMVQSNKEIAEIRKKLSLYESYLSYLEGLYKTFEMLHYSIKHRISLINDEIKKY